jgi:uncharacterized protein YabE (DUF348 family)
MKIQVKVGEQSFEVEVGDTNARPIKAEIDGQTFEVWTEENQVVEVIPSQEAAPAPKAAWWIRLKPNRVTPFPLDRNCSYLKQ